MCTVLRGKLAVFTVTFWLEVYKASICFWSFGFMYAILYDSTISSYTFCWIPSLFLSRAKIASSTAFTYFSGLPIPEIDTSKNLIIIPGMYNSDDDKFNGVFVFYVDED